MIREYPILSLKERDRRWERAQGLLKEKGLQCLIVAGLKGRERYESYLTNEYLEGIVVFPVGGEPVYLTWAAHRVTKRLEGMLKKEPFWVKDISVGASGPGLVAALRKMGMDRERIGVVGLESKGPAEFEGIIPYTLWSHVLGELPRATFVDISDAFAGMMLVKSEEELALLRYSAKIGELACKAMMKATKAGATEMEIYTAITKVLHSHGATSPAPGLILTSGPENVSWGPPIWLYRGGKPRSIEKGDIVQAEIFPCYGSIETQQQMAIAVKPVRPVTRECAKAARRSYEIGLKTLKPGKTFLEICDAMEVPIAKQGYWHLTPLIHTLAPLSCVSSVCVNIDHLPGVKKYESLKAMPTLGGELVVKPGMAFELEPNACRGKMRVNIGGAVIVTEKGVEELNKLPAEMRIVE